eukprot:8541310-Heterocapsa_arctica.AAC.1
MVWRRMRYLEKANVEIEPGVTPRKVQGDEGRQQLGEVAVGNQQHGSDVVLWWVGTPGTPTVYRRKVKVVVRDIKLNASNNKR